MRVHNFTHFSCSLYMLIFYLNQYWSHLLQSGCIHYTRSNTNLSVSSECGVTASYSKLQDLIPTSKDLYEGQWINF